MNKDQFIKLSRELANGMPNISYHFRDVQEISERKGEGDRVVATVQITGHQVHSMNLYQLSLPPIPQLDKSVALPTQHWQFVVKGNRIVTIDEESVPGGGIPSLLYQLGVDAPIIQ